MDYKEAWEDLQRWLQQGKEYLEERVNETSGRSDGYYVLENKRLEGKLDGLKTCIYHMQETERMSGGQD